MALPVNPVINGSSTGITAVWGIGSVYSGIVTSFKRKKSSQKDYVMDGNGFKIAEIQFDHDEEFTLSLVCVTDTVSPECGDVITIDTVACIVQDAEMAYDQKGWKKLDITAKKYAAFTPAD